MLKKVVVVVVPVQVDSIYLQGCKFWNCSKFLRKQLGDWHVGVRSGLASVVVVVGSIVTPWRYYGNSAERGSDLNFVLKDNSKQKQQKEKNTTKSFGVLSLAPATRTRILGVSETGQRSA